MGSKEIIGLKRTHVQKGTLGSKVLIWLNKDHLAQKGSLDLQQLILLINLKGLCGQKGSLGEKAHVSLKNLLPTKGLNTNR